MAKWRAELDAAYGKVSRDEYKRLEAETDAAVRDAEKESDTLREDYELGIHDGEFSVSYSCSCQRCPFQWRYKHSERVPKDGEKRP